MTLNRRQLLAGLLATFLAGCGSTGTEGFSSGSPGYPPFGATPGGVKDMTLARELVAAGKVPPKEAFLVEAMFSEHDFPLAGPPCNTLFCTQAAMGIEPGVSGDPSGWVHVGLASSIDPDTFQRPSLTLVLVVDVSGSMDYNYSNGNTGFDIARLLLEGLVDRLGEQDRIAIISFSDTAKLLLDVTSGSDHAAANAVIAALHSEGGTNMEAGAGMAYSLANGLTGVTDETRVVLVTDFHPNIGATGPSAFENIVIGGVEQGVSLTLFGVALGLDPVFTEKLSHWRGANAFTLADVEGVAERFEESWPWMVSPIAYDFSLTARPGEGFDVIDSYGFPGEPTVDEVSLSVSTIFLSKGRGALLVEIAPETHGAISTATANLVLTYTDPQGGTHEEHLPVHYQGEPLDAEGRWFPQASTAKATALALLVTAMRDSAESYETDHAAAVAILELATLRFTSDATAIADPVALDPEVAFANALLTLMKADAPQGTEYPQ